MTRAQEDGVAVADYDAEIRLAGDERHFVNYNFLRHLDAKGEYRGLVLVFEDISREKRMKSTLTRYMAKDIAERVLSDPRIHPIGTACGHPLKSRGEPTEGGNGARQGEGGARDIPAGADRMPFVGCCCGSGKLRGEGGNGGADPVPARPGCGCSARYPETAHELRGPGLFPIPHLLAADRGLQDPFQPGP